MRLVLTDADVQTILNALRCAEAECLNAAKTLPELPESQSARKAFVDSSHEYRKLADKLGEADVIHYGNI